ncbi:hypothetical protein EDD22DRAFT_846996 [Suillus occidentalis]|nr:hypothetical protein EDD22DRAFT_846993 [Suillus occidentalis]KAG1762536.1 hypothetical protein EDD22DRAFT_846996 [Suillus occidentalis]
MRSSRRSVDVALCRLEDDAANSIFTLLVGVGGCNAHQVFWVVDVSAFKFPSSYPYDLVSCVCQEWSQLVFEAVTEFRGHSIDVEDRSECPVCEASTFRLRALIVSKSLSCCHVDVRYGWMKAVTLRAVSGKTQMHHNRHLFWIDQ